MSVTGLREERSTSLVGRRTSVSKLNGKVYTPLPVAMRMLDALPWPEGGGTLLDPSCGGGVFLEAALRKVARQGLPPRQIREVLAGMEGWDIDGKALQEARDHLEALSVELGLGAVPVLRHQDALDPTPRRFRYVVGNPPYLEAKRMPQGDKDRIRALCPVAATGAFDLYAAFLERAHQLLEPGGQVVFLVPNRFLVLHSGQALRRLFLSEYGLRIWDLSREQVFPDAAVYPVVVHARHGPPTGLEGLAMDLGRLGGVIPVLPQDPPGRSVFEKVLRHGPLSDHLSTRWCVSFHRAGLRDAYVFPAQPPSPFARRFLGGGRFAGNREVEPFRIAWEGTWIDHDEERARRDHNVLPPHSLFQGPKIVLCQNARRARAALDLDGYVLKDTFLAMKPLVQGPGAVPLLKWVLLVLHSDLFHFVYEHLYAGTRKGGGFLHFLPGYLDPFPLPPPPDLDRVGRIHDALARGEGDPAEAEELVSTSCGLSRDEKDRVQKYSTLL